MISPGPRTFAVLQWLERTAAYAQGKGYGTATPRQEVAAALEVCNRSPRLVIDIGGNVGAYALEVRRKLPEAEIHVFEPAATNIDVLQAKLGADPRIKLNRYAVSDQTGAAVLYSDRPGSGLASLTRRRLDHFGKIFDHEESVQTLRFEDYWNETLERRPLDLVKLDVEGHELTALTGFGEAVAETRVLQFEFGGCNIDTRTFFQDFFYFFGELGFTIYRISPLGLDLIEKYREVDEFFSTTNFLAVNRSTS